MDSSSGKTGNVSYKRYLVKKKKRKKKEAVIFRT